MGVEQLHMAANIPQFIEGAPISNLMYAIWSSREDLQIAFDLKTSVGQDAFRRWCEASLLREYGIGALTIDETSDNKSTELVSVISKSNYHRLARMESMLARLSKALPSKIRASGKSYWNRILAEFARNVARKSKTSNQAENVPATQCFSEENFALPGANLIGYVFSESGMGEHVRMSAASFAATDINFGVINFDYGVPSRTEALLRHGTLESTNRYKANVFHINADQMLHVYAKLGGGFFSDRLNISYPFWELSKFPSEWTPFLSVMDEVWAPTKFIQESISNALGKLVHYMPVSIDLPLVENKGRKNFGIPEGRFAFLLTFDFFSYIHRKNPWATVLAFMLAFPKLDENVCLVVKVMNADESNDDWKKLKEIASRDRRIILINKVMTIDDLLSLKLACDCYVSLHRSEGLGRGPMEAMLLGKPTILTNYSGSSDYAREDNSCLVNYSLVPIEPRQYVHWSDQVWADPDIEHAAWHMKRLANDSTLALSIGKAAQHFISEQFSPARCGALYQQRLRELGVV